MLEVYMFLAVYPWKVQYKISHIPSVIIIHPVMWVFQGLRNLKA